MTTAEKVRYSLQGLQCRLAKDGSDDDLHQAFSEEELKRLDVDRTARLKTILRLGLYAERTAGQNSSVQDEALTHGHVIASIGSKKFFF